MGVAIVLLLSILLQLAAALLAIRLIWVTHAGKAWVLIAAGVCLMAVRRSLTLMELIEHGLSDPPPLLPELVALGISVLMVVGVAYIAPLFLSIRRSEKALRESERKLAALMGNLPGIAYRCLNDRNWTMQFVSEGCLELTGYKSSSLIENRTVAFKDLIHPDDRESVWSQVQQALAERRPFRMVYRIHDATGREKWVWEQGTGVYSDAGEVVALEGFITDVTERVRAEEALRKVQQELEERVKARTSELAEANQQLQHRVAERQQAEEALRESEQRFRSMVEATSDWIWAVDPDGVYSYASPKVEDLLGYEPREVIGKTPFDLMSADEAQRARGSFREILASRKPFVRLEKTTLHKDGRRVVLESSGVPILDAAGRLRGYRGVDRDISKPKEDEARLKETMAKLEQSNRDLQQFAYSASHDLQEPLRMMGSYLQALKQHAGESLDQHARDFITLSLDSAGRMQQLINDLLAYARVGTRGKHFEDVDANAVLERVIADLQATIESAGGEVTRDRLPTITADPTLLAQLFQNLIGNAVKFHGQAAPRVHVSAEPRGEQWVFSVKDNGIGIDPEHLGRIFEIFERLHPSDRYPGTGIGLAICKRVVERHNGRIWCDSVPGQGTTFSFSIPQGGGTRA